MPDSSPVVPLRFDLSSLIERSVATLYSHLVTRPTGQALRLGIESQIGEMATLCLSVLDFTQVVVLDYSCADETVAKLVQRFQGEDRPADAFFIARGVGEAHRDTIDDVLARQGLCLAADLVEDGATLLGSASDTERAAWHALERLRRADAAAVAAEIDRSPAEAAEALDSLAEQRVLIRRGQPPVYVALTALLRPE